MKKLGYGPDARLPVTVTTRNVAAYRDPAVILIDQLKNIFVEGTLNPIDTTQWYPTVMRKDYTVGFTVPLKRGSTIPTRCSTRTIPADRSVIIPAIVIPRSTDSSTSN